MFCKKKIVCHLQQSSNPQEYIYFGLLFLYTNIICMIFVLFCILVFFFGGKACNRFWKKEEKKKQSQIMFFWQIALMWYLALISIEIQMKIDDKSITRIIWTCQSYTTRNWICCHELFWNSLLLLIIYQKSIYFTHKKKISSNLVLFQKWNHMHVLNVAIKLKLNYNAILCNIYFK